MFEKLPHLPFLFQGNSAEQREILGHTPRSPATVRMLREASIEVGTGHQPDLLTSIRTKYD
jgi:hypothetical protein